MKDITCWGYRELSQRDPVPQFVNDRVYPGDHEEIKDMDSSDLSQRISLDLCEVEMIFDSRNVAVEPFWPLCMYELRGKCNDNECPWQHLKDSLSGDVSRLPQRDSNGYADIRYVCHNADGTF